MQERARKISTLAAFPPALSLPRVAENREAILSRRASEFAHRAPRERSARPLDTPTTDYCCLRLQWALRGALHRKSQIRTKRSHAALSLQSSHSLGGTSRIGDRTWRLGALVAPSIEGKNYCVDIFKAIFTEGWKQRPRAANLAAVRRVHAGAVREREREGGGREKKKRDGCAPCRSSLFFARFNAATNCPRAHNKNYIQHTNIYTRITMHTGRRLGFWIFSSLYFSRLFSTENNDLLKHSPSGTAAGGKGG